jgi:hypothetical protein
MKLFLSIFIIIFFLIAAAAIFMWSGRYNVAATVPHWDITARLMEGALSRSIKFHSRGIQPPSLKGLKLIKVGFREYHAMCRSCHGAPGYPQAEFAQGLYPKPPNLGSKDMPQLNDAELYWVVKNGIKMTGMPAFGPTHDQDELWAIVAFLKRMPSIQSKEYEAMAKEAGLHKGGEKHSHGAKEQ